MLINLMDFAKFLELLFFPSNVVLVVFLILIYDGFAVMSAFDLFIYGLAVVGLPFSFFIMNRRSKRKNRAALISLFLTMLIFTLFSQLFESLRNLRFLYLTTYTLLFLGLVIFFIRLNWRISLHVSILTTAITILAFFNESFYALFLLVPLLAWSRIKLRVHTFSQALAGFFVGFFIPFIFFV